VPLGSTSSGEDPCGGWGAPTSISGRFSLRKGVREGAVTFTWPTWAGDAEEKLTVTRYMNPFAAAVLLRAWLLSGGIAVGATSCQALRRTYTFRTNETPEGVLSFQHGCAGVASVT
jgi:hypothetical protein